MNRETAAVVVFSLGTAALAFVLGANLYELIFLIPNWRTPEGLQAYRTLVAHRSPALFFQPLGNLSIVCLVVGTVLGWPSAAARRPWALGTTLAMLSALALTLAFFLPLNLRLFVRPLNDAWPEVAKLVDRWAALGYLRLAITGGALVAAMGGLRR
jgi:hypothetical protein